MIDERLDLDAAAAASRRPRPDWQFVMVGPVVKIDPATLPRRAEHPLPRREAYAELPAYLAGWDVALLPFARNEATRFISPTKTPEYLAAGRPVVSTSIRDVVRPYGERGLARIADTPDDVRRGRSRARARRGADRERLAAPRRRVPGRHVLGPHLAAHVRLMADGVIRRAAPASRAHRGARARRRDSRPRRLRSVA